MSACLLCGSPHTKLLYRASDRLYRTTSKVFSVVRCEECGLVRMDPAPPPEELHKYYPDNYWFSPGENAASRLEEGYRRLVLRDHVAFIEAALADTNAKGPLLDAGCGGGLLLGMMRERGHRVIGLDISPDAAGIAWRRQGVPAMAALLTAAPLPEGSCKAVSLFHVVEHLENPRAHLEAAARLLAPGGRLIVQVPDAASWQFRLLGHRWNGLDVPRHLFDFRGEDVDRLLGSCGFEVLRRKHFSLRDNPAGFASSIAPGLDPMARRVRKLPESTGGKIARDLLYLAILAAALPFTVVEAAFSSGSTIMVEARRRS
jgi:SAM-dependent methyltransferase